MHISTAQNESTHDKLIVDTGGGKFATITLRAWMVTAETGHTAEFSQYNDNTTPQQCKIVNAVTKAHIKGISNTILLGVNYATLMEDENETESLLQPFDCMRHGIKIDLTPVEYGGEGGMLVEDCFIPFEYDGESLFLNIGKPTMDDIDTLEYFELTSPLPQHTSEPIKNAIRRQHQQTHTTASTLPLIEWRRRLGMIPEATVKKTLENTTQFYLDVECEN